VAHVPPVLLILVDICHQCHRCQRHQWYRRGGKFTASVVDTGGKFAKGVVDTGGKFATVSLIPARRCTLTCEYLRQFSKKFEMTQMLFSGDWGKMINEKT
jgi:hypothetical protein